jgi:RNA ligase (TIGR02306 family)
MERKLASIRTITAIDPIPGADAIEVAKVDGWQVAVKKGDFQVNQLAIFCEPDSWVPKSVAPFLCKSVKTFNGVEGERLRTIKLRGQLSQGLLLPLSVLEEEGVKFTCWMPGDDVTGILRIQKYEKPLSAQLAGLAKGNFPSFLKKTDQERIQNLTKEFEQWKSMGLTFEVTEKLDGSSMTVFFKDGNMGVCSRNLELIEDDNNTFWKVAKQAFPPGAITEGANVVFQGELIGPGIQGNPYKLTEHTMFLFDVADMDAVYLDANFRYILYSAIQTKLDHVPTISTRTRLPNTIAEVLAMADGVSTLANVPREGLVWKCEQEPCISFKAISNKWLLKEKD